MVNNKGLMVRTPNMGSLLTKFFDNEFNISRFDSLLDEMWDVYDDLWKNSGLVGGSFAELQSPMVKFPKVNVKTFDDHYEIDIAVAGFDKDDVELELKDNCLYIKAEKSVDSSKEEEGKYIMREIASRSFRRCVALPEKIDTSEAANSVSYSDGIIKCNLKKLDKVDNTIKLSIK